MIAAQGSPLDCDDCGHPHSPSCYSEALISSPSGHDLFGPWTCHECGSSGVVAFSANGFIEAYNLELAARMVQAKRYEQKELQRERSEIGRQVARFREDLQHVTTVEDIGWKT